MWFLIGFLGWIERGLVVVVIFGFGFVLGFVRGVDLVLCLFVFRSRIVVWRVVIGDIGVGVSVGLEG